MHNRLKLRPTGPAPRFLMSGLLLFYVAVAIKAESRAQETPSPQPAIRSQSRSADSPGASGSGARAEGDAAMPATDHGGMKMGVSHEGMAMPAGDEIKMSFGPLPDSRDASGTAWQPDATPMHAHHSMLGDWALMTHYNAFLAYDNQSGRRGDEQLNSINWLMLMASRRKDANDLMLRAMFSLEPWTTTAKGYPLLFQSGEAFRGRALVDRQHPHDLFMEVAARYRRLLPDDSVFSLYVAPAGEPALGPPAFPHRMSAMDNPAAPISHHWLDSTHISFGVLTAGVARKTWQIEGSYFNGREPDEDRLGIDLSPLDSYSGRFTWNPNESLSAQISHGYLKTPEELHPEEHLRRTSASVIHLMKLSGKTHLATTLAWGRNDHGHGATDAFLIEPSYMAEKFSIFGRAEHVEKRGEELNLLPDDRKIPVKQVTLGATHELVYGKPWQLALGGSVTYSFMPRDLDAVYGRRPIGFWLFLRLRPGAMKH